MSNLKQLEEDINKGYEQCNLLPICCSFYEDDGVPEDYACGVCALTAAYILHNGRAALVGTKIDHGKVVTDWATKYYELGKYEAGDLACGYDTGMMGPSNAPYITNLDAFIVGVELKDKWKPVTHTCVSELN